MRRTILIFLALFTFIKAGAQDFIGLNEPRIKVIMSDERPALTIDDKVKNEVYRYLKYTSGEEGETWIIFLDEKGICNGIRITYGKNSIEEKRAELNSLHKLEGIDNWVYRSRGKLINIDLKDETWFFTVTYKISQHREKSGDDRTA